MHNNYYFIRKLISELKTLLEGSVLMECYSQNKDELVLSFLGEGNREIHIIANLGSDFSCLYFPKEYHRAKKNSISLFNEIPGLKVSGVVPIPNERLFIINFREGFRLAFKLFGNRGNILLFKGDELVSIFKNSLKQDRSFVISESGREIDFSFANFRQHEFDLKKAFFTLGEVPELYLKSKGYEGKSPEEKYKMVVDMLDYLEDPEFFITKVNEKVILSLFDFGTVLSKHRSAVDAVNTFYHAHYRFNYLEKLRTRLLTLLDSKIKGVKSYIQKSREKIEELTGEFPFEKIADIIMANLHAIPPGTEKITLYDFYRDQDLEVYLKKDISPQKHAEALYKKSKKRPAEISRLQGQQEIKEKEMEFLQKERNTIESIGSHKELETFVKKYILAPEKEQEASSLKFKECEFMGYKIYVGKSAENNDELTQKFAGKDDLWLHAKDVQGSHVVVKFRSGQNFPKNVIEKAASLAAFYSKRRNETLCPVIYTQKKYVRKVKGAPKGAVRVERESVIMVTPGDF